MSILPSATDNGQPPRPNRAPGSIWATRRNMTGGYVRTVEGDRIEIVVRDDWGRPDFVTVSRSEARLLAKRINECLDATVLR